MCPSGGTATPLARDAHGRRCWPWALWICHSRGGTVTPCWNAAPAGAEGLTIETRLFELNNGQALGRCVPLSALEACADLNCPSSSFCQGCRGGAGRAARPRANCVDGSADVGQHLRPGRGLLHALARCEEQLNTEFANGASRVFASEDLLRPDARAAAPCGTTCSWACPTTPPTWGGDGVQPPALREQSYLARKQDLLRAAKACWACAGVSWSEDRGRSRAPHRHRGQRHGGGLRPDHPRPAGHVGGCRPGSHDPCAPLWGGPVRAAAECRRPRYLERGLGDGVLYDRARVWAEQRELVADGLLRPELALAWYFGLPHETEAELRRVRERLMPKGGEH